MQARAVILARRKSGAGSRRVAVWPIVEHGEVEANLSAPAQGVGGVADELRLQLGAIGEMNDGDAERADIPLDIELPGRRAAGAVAILAVRIERSRRVPWARRPSSDETSAKLLPLRPHAAGDRSPWTIAYRLDERNCRHSRRACGRARGAYSEGPEIGPYRRARENVTVRTTGERTAPSARDIRRNRGDASGPIFLGIGPWTLIDAFSLADLQVSPRLPHWPNPLPFR